MAKLPKNKSDSSRRSRTKGKSKRRRGRPKRYTFIRDYLKRNKVYSSASIVRLLEEKGFFKNKEDVVRLKRNMRVSLNRISIKRKFCRKGDGLVRLEGQKPTVGWYGKHWIQALQNH